MCDVYFRSVGDRQPNSALLETMHMTLLDASSNMLFRESPSKPDMHHNLPEAGEEAEAEISDEEEYYVCVDCMGIITSRANEIFVDGAHCHTFANPMGIVFDIGCFKNALGCATAGPASDEFTWFQGYQWKIAYCRYCLIHMGWQFINAGGDHFFGLIEDRIKLATRKME